jgi:membrane protease YdiL (CAAX protease family)
MLGSLASQGSGFLSAYSAFRISVPRFQDEDGKYRFLQEEESVSDLLAAPFRFGHLLEPTTLVPLGILGGAVLVLVQYERDNHRGADWTASPDDAPFYGALAYNAGVTEEAVFRGWLLPVAHQYLGQRFWLANSAQALLFGAAHYSKANPVPWPQTLLGLYFGWLARRNEWTLSESIFLHSWWDMILFAGQIAVNRGDVSGTARFRFDVPLAW